MVTGPVWWRGPCRLVVLPRICPGLAWHGLGWTAQPAPPLTWPPPQGLPELREAVSALYTSTQPEELVVAVPQELIYLAMVALCKPGDHIVVTHPGKPAAASRLCSWAICGYWQRLCLSWGGSPGLLWVVEERMPAAAPAGYQSLYSIAQSLGCEVSFWAPTWCVWLPGCLAA